MEFCLTSLGCENLTLPIVGSRRRQRQETNKVSSAQAPQLPSANKKGISSCHRDSFLVYLEQAYNIKSSEFKFTTKASCRDDDTASTLSTTTDGDDSLGFTKSVSFAEPLVTAVITRPLTTKEDKYYLHYNEHDYVDFKIEFLTGKERCRRVSFEREVVQEVHQVESLAKHSDDLYYSESELQQ